MQNDSNKKKLLIMSLFFSVQFIGAMEECDIIIEETLPAEMNLYVTQFLGSTLAETLKNIAKLSEVDKYFNSLITQNQKSIGPMLRDRFGDERLKILENAAKTGKSEVIAKLLSLNLIRSNDIKNIQQTLLDSAMESLNYNFLDYLFSINALEDNPSIKINDTFVTPVDYVIIKLNDQQSNWPFIVKMIKNGANVNQMTSNGDTPLGFAFSLGNIDFFEELLKLGADPTIKNKHGLSVIDSFEGAPSFVFPFRDALNKYGFTVAFKESNKRGRKFTVQRKKINHRGSSMAKNLRESNRRYSL